MNVIQNELKVLIVHLLVFSICVFLPKTLGNDSRKLETFLNPDCTICKDSTNVLYVKAIGQSDTLHFLWSTIGAPSVLMVQTSPESRLNIDWPLMLNNSPGALSFFPDHATYSFAAVLSKILEFDDTDDVGYMTDDLVTDVNVTNVDPVYIKWEGLNSTLSHSSNLCTISLKSVLNESLTQLSGLNGTISLELSVDGEFRRSKEFPHLQFTSNSTQMKIILDKLWPSYNHSRFAFEFTSVTSSLKSQSEWRKKKEESIDDEYTPGMFSVVNLLTPAHNDNRTGGYFYWKPLTYTTKDHSVHFSSEAHLSKLININVLPNSIARAYFSPEEQYEMTSWNLSLGSKGDKFYNSTQFSTWTVMIGLGDPPPEKLSLAVILFTSIGLGTPLLAIVLGTIYLECRRLRCKDDDLMLSRDNIQ